MSRWQTTSCNWCDKEIPYLDEWGHVHEYCKDCRAPLTKFCKGCDRAIQYKVFWENVPEYCKDCRAPLTRSCKGCDRAIQYKRYWSNVPEYCSDCREWKYKACVSCGDQVRYKSYWEHEPNRCKSCKEQRRGGLERTYTYRDQISRASRTYTDQYEGSRKIGGYWDETFTDSVTGMKATIRHHYDENGNETHQSRPDR